MYTLDLYLLFFIIGKTKLAPLVPALIHDFLLNDERGTPLRVEVSPVNITLWSLSSRGAEIKNKVINRNSKYGCSRLICF